MFDAIGRARGLRTKRSWSQTAPSDGVWLPARAVPGVPEIPLVAIEVSCTEGPKALRGSVTILEEISPALGILLLHEDQIRRGIRAGGGTEAEADRRIADLLQIARNAAMTSRQRIEIWKFAQLSREFRLATGRASIYELAPKPRAAARPWAGSLRPRDRNPLERR
jgi:hypothetical protein